MSSKAGAAQGQQPRKGATPRTAAGGATSSSNKSPKLQQMVQAAGRGTSRAAVAGAAKQEDSGAGGTNRNTSPQKSRQQGQGPEQQDNSSRSPNKSSFTTVVKQMNAARALSPRQRRPATSPLTYKERIKLHVERRRQLTSNPGEELFPPVGGGGGGTSTSGAPAMSSGAAHEVDAFQETPGFGMQPGSAEDSPTQSQSVATLDPSPDGAHRQQVYHPSRSNHGIHPDDPMLRDYAVSAVVPEENDPGLLLHDMVSPIKNEGRMLMEPFAQNVEEDFAANTTHGIQQEQLSIAPPGTSVARAMSGTSYYDQQQRFRANSADSALQMMAGGGQQQHQQNLHLQEPSFPAPPVVKKNVLVVELPLDPETTKAFPSQHWPSETEQELEQRLCWAFGMRFDFSTTSSSTGEKNKLKMRFENEEISSLLNQVLPKLSHQENHQDHRNILHDIADQAFSDTEQQEKQHHHALSERVRIEFLAYRKALDEQERSLHMHRAQLTEQERKHQAEVDELQTEIARLQAATETQCGELQASLDRAQEEFGLVENVSEERKLLLGEAETKILQLETAKGETDAQLQIFEQKAEQLQTEKDKLTLERTELQHKLEEVVASNEKERDQAEKKRESLFQQNTHLQAEYEVLTAKLLQAKDEAKVALQEKEQQREALTTEKERQVDQLKREKHDLLATEQRRLRESEAQMQRFYEEQEQEWVLLLQQRADDVKRKEADCARKIKDAHEKRREDVLHETNSLQEQIRKENSELRTKCARMETASRNAKQEVESVKKQNNMLLLDRQDTSAKLQKALETKRNLQEQVEELKTVVQEQADALVSNQPPLMDSSASSMLMSSYSARGGGAGGPATSSSAAGVQQRSVRSGSASARAAWGAGPGAATVNNATPGRRRPPNNLSASSTSNRYTPRRERNNPASSSTAQSIHQKPPPLLNKTATRAASPPPANYGGSNLNNSSSKESIMTADNAHQGEHQHQQPLSYRTQSSVPDEHDEIVHPGVAMSNQGGSVGPPAGKPQTQTQALIKARPAGLTSSLSSLSASSRNPSPAAAMSGAASGAHPAFHPGGGGSENTTPTQAAQSGGGATTGITFASSKQLARSGSASSAGLFGGPVATSPASSFKHLSTTFNPGLRAPSPRAGAQQQQLVSGPMTAHSSGGGRPPLMSANMQMQQQASNSSSCVSPTAAAHQHQGGGGQQHMQMSSSLRSLSGSRNMLQTAPFQTRLGGTNNLNYPLNNLSSSRVGGVGGTTATAAAANHPSANQYQGQVPGGTGTIVQNFTPRGGNIAQHFQHKQNLSATSNTNGSSFRSPMEGIMSTGNNNLLTGSQPQLLNLDVSNINTPNLENSFHSVGTPGLLGTAGSNSLQMTRNLYASAQQSPVNAATGAAVGGPPPLAENNDQEAKLAAMMADRARMEAMVERKKQELAEKKRLALLAQQQAGAAAQGS
ncbi:unnamed protein product [Amoebophrya sp. A120]|nr:unnamed protein product [Amoebophrya sp. A120]|eukprot:GSA120T00018232001.1